jgi:DNA-binding transcriptional ArsR family regulator
MCIAAELDSPLILFVFVLGTGIYIMLKVKPQDKKKSLNNGTVYNVIFRSVILLIIKMSKQLEAIFGRNAQIVVLGYLLRHHDSVTYLSGIAEATGLSHSSVARVIEPLLEMGIVREENCGKQIRTFRINKDSGVYKLLIRFVDDLDKVLSE